MLNCSALEFPVVVQQFIFYCSVGNRNPPAVVARPLINGYRSVSTERMDRSNNGKPPTEKRVQWALDSPKKSPSPTVQTTPAAPSNPHSNADSQVVRVPVLPSPTVQTRPPIAHEIQSWSRGFGSSDQNGPSGGIPWQREEHHRMMQWRIAEARRLRDEEITALQNRRSLTETEEERLRTLLLERDFQRRAEEVLQHNDGEEEEEQEEDEEDDADSVRQVNLLSSSSGVCVHSDVIEPIDLYVRTTKVSQEMIITLLKQFFRTEFAFH